MAEASSSVMSSPVLRTGYLVKQGHFAKTWKRRYFLLQGTTLQYFVEADTCGGEKVSNYTRGIDLKGTVTVASFAFEDGGSAQRRRLLVRGRPKDLLLEGTEEELTAWCASMRQALEVERMEAALKSPVAVPKDSALGGLQGSDIAAA